MKQCKYIGEIRDKDGFRELNKNQIYYYEIKIHDRELYPYYIYTSSDNKKQIAFGPFSEKYFKTLFIDVKEERKQKLEKILKL